LGGQTPLNPRQLLLVNMLTDVAPAMAIAVQPPARRSFRDLRRDAPECSRGSALAQAIVWRAVCSGRASTRAWCVWRGPGRRDRRGAGAAPAVGTPHSERTRPCLTL